MPRPPPRGLVPRAAAWAGGRAFAWTHDRRLWLVAVGFILRLVWVLAVPSRPVGDFALYREAAEHLSDQGQLDSEFVYMPGYVMLLAALRSLGAGLLAAKLVGVVAGTVVVFATGGIAQALFGRRAGLAATALVAVWPAGIAIASVTGTDMPAAALVTLGVHALVAQGPRRPGRAAALAGLAMGLASWVRAVAAPLAGLSLLYWLVAGARRPAALARTGITLGVAFLVLLPWGLRNHAVYGELFLTDSHGGHTALVGANPNSEGTYSRSLNLMFTKGTGYRLFEPPSRHRAADRAAYQLARAWTAFEPAYAVGLVVAKADRLLTHERNLLYWPLFRQGVLEPDQRVFFDAHRVALELMADLFWWAVAGLAAAGLTICVAQRLWLALSVVVFPMALIAIYTLFFAEVRYHVAIVPLFIPYAAFAIDWAAARARREPDNEPGKSGGAPGGDGRRTAWIAAGAVVALFVCWTAVRAGGALLRARHRWAVAVCTFPEPGQTHLCPWRRGPRAGGDSESPVRGTWDGVGLRVRPAAPRGVLASARTEIPVAAGRFRVSATVALPPGRSADPGVAVALRANGRVIARAVSPSVALAGVVDIATPPLVLEIQVEPAGIGSTADGVVWVSQLLVERF